MTATVTTRDVASPLRRRRGERSGWRAALPYLCAILVLAALFKVWPIGRALLASLYRYDTLGQPVATVGTDHLTDTIADQRFRSGLWLTVAATAVKVPVQVGVGLLAALALRTQTLGNRVARATLICPVFLGLPVTVLVFQYLFDRNVGVVNAALGTLGVAPIAWLFEGGTARFVVLTLSLWRDLGLTVLVYLAGLTAIPDDLVQAARLDGATRRQLLTTLTIPLLRRSTQFAVVLATLATFQLVVPVLILTRGGPNGATDLASYQIYEEGFRLLDHGRASAMSLWLAGGLLLLVAVELWWLRPKWSYR